MLMKFIIVYTVFVAIAQAEEAQILSTTKGNSDVKSRTALLDKLMTGYKTENYPDNATIRFGLSLINVEFNHEHGILQSNVYIRQTWNDNRLTWDAKKEGISILIVPSNRLWLPDTTIYNGPDHTMPCSPANAFVYSSGLVLWVPSCNIKSYCNFTLSSDPNGVQECNMRFGSWTFHGLTMGLDFYWNKFEADLSDFVAWDKFNITKNVAVREQKFYPCCKEPFVHINYRLGIQKLGKTICPQA